MANKRRLNYELGLTVDTSQLQKSLNDAFISLNKISNLKSGSGVSSAITDAARAAKELQQHLSGALNPSSGKLDLSKFEASLKASGNTLSEYAVKLSAIGDTGKTAFFQVASAISKAEIPLKRSSKLMDSLWTTMKNTVRWQVTTSILHGFVGQLESSVGYVQDLNESLNKIQIVTKQSSEQMKEFAKNANEAAAQLNTTTTNYTDASLIYYQQGLNDEEVAGRTETTIKLANVSAKSAETVSEWMTAIWNNFYDGSKTLEYYADVMTALGATTASSSAEIATGIQKFAAVANTVGLSYEYAASALATLTANTREAPEVVGNSLKTLFARIQGLSLGETLDDGTDLNKYSKALMAVGVNIKDVSGELKSMDQILTETASKWETLNKDQQTALAQTVAGVRQYNQFVSLMDNWADFEENLVTAYGATGELDKQAEIFADSWEAARKRVKAAAEDVYDSLINEDFFIGFDDGLSNILHGTATVIDNLGGMKGAIFLVGSAVTQVFGDKMAQGLRDMAYNLSVISGRADKVQMKFKEMAGDSALQMASAISSSKGTKSSLVSEAIANSNDVQLQNLLNAAAKQLTSEQLTQLSNYKEIITMVGRLKSDYEKIVEENIAVTDSLVGALQNQDELVKSADIYRQSVVNAKKELKGITIPDQDLFFKKITNDINNVITAYRQLVTTAGRMEQISNQYKILSGDTEKYKKELNSLSVKFKEISGVDLSKTPKKALLEMEDIIQRVLRQADSLYQVLGNAKGMDKDTLLKFSDSVSMIGPNLEAAKAAGQMVNAETEKFILSTYQATLASNDWAAKLINCSNQLMRYGMMIQSIQSLGNIWSNDDLTTAEKFAQSLTSVGMILPSLISLINTFKNTVTGYTTVQVTAAEVEKAVNAEKAKGVIVNEAGEAVIKQKLLTDKLGNRQTIVNTVAIKSNTAGVEENTVAVVANTAAWYANPIFLAMAAITALITVFTTYNTVIEKNTERKLKNNQAILDAAKAAEEEANSNLELIKSTEDALKIYEESGDNKQELDDLTRSLAEAYNLEGDALAKLSGKYEDYNDVLNRAKEKRRQELEDELDTQRDALDEMEYKVLSEAGTSTTFRGWEFVGGEESAAKELFNKYLGTGDFVVQSAFGSSKANKYSTDSIKDILNLYDDIDEMMSHVDEYMTERQQQQSGMLQSAMEWYNSMTDVVEEYRDLVQLIDKLEVQTGRAGLSISDDSIDSVEKYKKWHDEVVDVLSDEYDNLDDIEDIIDSIVRNSTNSGLQGIKDLSDAIDDVQSKVSDKDWDVSKYFTSGDYDTSVLASMNWQGLNQESFKSAYDITKQFMDLNTAISDSKTNLSDMQNILSIIKKEKWDLDVEDYTKISNAIEWGKEGVIEFTSFLQMTQTEQEAFINSLISSSYQEITSNLIDKIDIAKSQISELEEWRSQQNADELQEAQNILSAWDKIGEAYNQHQQLGFGEIYDFDKLSNDLKEAHFSMTPEQLEELFSKAPDAFQEQMEKDTHDYKVKVDAVANADGMIESLQNEIERTKKEIVITARVNFDTRLSDIEGSVDNIVSIFDAISKGVEKTTNGVGEKVWGISREAAKAIESVYPGFIANAELLRDGTFALTDDMYQAFFDSANGQLAVDTQSKVGMLQNIIIMLEQKRASAQSALGIAEKLASGEVTLEQLSDEQKEILYTNFVNGKEVANGEMLKDEANMLNESDTNHVNLWENVSNYSAQGAQNMATNVATSTGLVLKNLEKIRDAAWIASQQVSMIGTPDAHKLDLDTTSIWDTSSIGSWANLIDTSSSKDFIDSLEEQTLLTEDDLFNDPNEALKARSKKIGEQLSQYYSSLIGSYDAEIAAARVAQSKLLEGIDNAYDKLGKVQKSGSSNSKQQYYVDKEKKQLDEVLDRYHLITREIENQNDVLDDISNNIDRSYGGDKLKNYTKELKALEKQQENYNKKLEEANAWEEFDRGELERLFGTDGIQYTDTGEIANYVDLMIRTIEEYSAFDDEYQAFQKKYTETSDKDAKNALEEEKALWEARKQVEDKIFEDRQEAISNYEDSLDKQQEMIDNLEETARKMADNKLSQIEYRLEIVLDVKSMKDALRDFDKSAQEIFGDYLTHGFGGMFDNLNIEEIAKNQAQAEAAMLPEYQKQYNDLVDLYESTTDEADRARIMSDIQDLQSKVLGSAEAIVEWVNSIEEIVPQAVEAAAERFAQFTDQLEHNTTVLDTIKELYTLQGVTYKTMDGFNRLQKVSQERLESQVAQAQLNKSWFNEAQEKLNMAQERLDSFTGNESSTEYDFLKKSRDAYLEEFNKAQEAYLSSAKDAMETAQQMYLDQIEKATYEFGQAVSNGIGLDLLQDKYDHYIEKDERYFDKVNEAYQTTAWFNKLQEDIDKATNSTTKDRLKQLQDEINVRREGNKLSQYDLDILNAKYEVLKAQMALEDAQNAKNKVQLVRDRQGNWNYQYTADPTQVEGAEQDLLDAENEWYNIAKQQVTDVTGEIISTWNECQQKIKEIYSDMTLTDQERSDRAAEIYAYYTDKIKFLEEEKQVAIADMTEAGNASLFTSAVVLGDEITDLTGITAEDIKNIVAESGQDITGLLTADNETIKNIIASNTDLIDLFDNVYARDLDNMTTNTDKFEDLLKDTMTEAEDDFRNYGQTVNDVANETGTTLDDLSTTTDEVSDSTDRLRDSGLDAAETLWELIGNADDLASSYAGLTSEIWQTVEALKALAAQQASYNASKATTDDKFYKNIDYSAAIHYGIAHGLMEQGDQTYNTLFNQRENKIDDMGLEEDYYGTRGQEAHETFAGYKKGDESNFYESIEDWKKMMHNLGVPGYDTGGYTGIFNDEKLAFLHQKELVLNSKDTENILSAVNAVREIDFAKIEKAIDGNAIAAMALLGEKLAAIVAAEPGTLEQNIHIDKVEFPNATDRNEIEEAFANLVNDAAQWSKRRS